jgi:sugar/nucleoside kinase (ribokinase family)
MYFSFENVKAIPMKTVNVLGDLNLDIILSGIGSYPSLGREILAQNRVLKAGGSAANVAMMLAVNDVPVRFFCRVGKDFAGEFVVKILEEYGVNTDTVCFSEYETTGVTVSLAYPDDRMYVTFPGTVSSTKPEELKGTYIREGEHLHLASYFLQEGLAPYMGVMLKDAKKAGMSTSLDPGGDPSGKWDVKGLQPYFQYIDWFFPNSDELLGFTRAESLEDALKFFPGEVTGIIVKAGDQGAFTRYHGKTRHFPAVAVEVIDTTCAGDCFDAGFLYGISSGASFSDAVNLGNRFGAHAVSTLGLPFHRIK